jgi:quercetin 2,3-dioxygenase
MKRKKFLATALSAIPMLAMAKSGITSPRSVNEPFVVRAGEARYGNPMFYKGKHPNNIVISKQDTNGAFSVFAYIGLDKIGPSTHAHLSQDEIFFVTEGTYRFLAGEKILELNAGDSIFLPRNVPHSWIQLTEKGQLIYAVHPAGTMEEFFIEMSEMKGPPTEAEAKKIHLKHGMKLIGPGLSL